MSNFYEGERVRTPKGDGDVLADTTNDDFVPVLLDSGRLEEFMVYELAHLGIPV